MRKKAGEGLPHAGFFWEVSVGVRCWQLLERDMRWGRSLTAQSSISLLLQIFRVSTILCLLLSFSFYLLSRSRGGSPLLSSHWEAAWLLPHFIWSTTFWVISHLMKGVFSGGQSSWNTASGGDLLLWFILDCIIAHDIYSITAASPWLGSFSKPKGMVVLPVTLPG